MVVAPYPMCSAGLAPVFPCGTQFAQGRLPGALLSGRPRVDFKRLTVHHADSAVLAEPGNNPSSGKTGGLVDRLLSLTANSDHGDALAISARQEADDLLRQLEELGKGTRPLENPLIFGNYNVEYVSAGQRQKGAPAGGRFRGVLGKLLFQTTVLAQSVLQPDIVTNKLEFRLLGFINGAVGLRGKLVSIPEEEGGPNNQDTVKVFFEPPVLSFPAGIHIRIGPTSSVVLKTTYLDERVRCGLGSRGSLFLFTRGGAADGAEMDQVGLQRCSALGKALLFGSVAGLLVNGGLLALKQGPPVIRAAGVVQVMLGLALGGVLSRGGIAEDHNDRPEVGRPAGEE